jgi:hypothetical protein
MLSDREGSIITIRTSHMDQSLENRIRERVYERSRSPANPPGKRSAGRLHVRKRAS